MSYEQGLRGIFLARYTSAPRKYHVPTLDSWVTSINVSRSKLLVPVSPFNTSFTPRTPHSDPRFFFLFCFIFTHTTRVIGRYIRSECKRLISRNRNLVIQLLSWDTECALFLLRPSLNHEIEGIVDTRVYTVCWMISSSGECITTLWLMDTLGGREKK